MKKVIFLSVSFFWLHTFSFGQTEKYIQLLEKAIPYWDGIQILNLKPFSDFKLELKDTSDFRDELYGLKIDTKILEELITNSKNIDTAFWNDAKLKKVILVRSKQQDISMKYITDKFKTQDSSVIEAYRFEANNYNNTNYKLRSILSFSRPIFDNSKQYAIICCDKGHISEDCRGMISLYQISNEQWNFVGNIYNCTF